MFKKVCIIGCGLIGSSLARAIKKNNLAQKIVSSNRSDVVNKKVIELNIVEDSSPDTKKMVINSDLIILATPLSSYENVIIKIKDSLKSGSILTDVGSVKGNIMNLVEKIYQKTFLGFRHTQLQEQRKVDLKRDLVNCFKIDGAFLLLEPMQKQKILIHLKLFGKK